MKPRKFAGTNKAAAIAAAFIVLLSTTACSGTDSSSSFVDDAVNSFLGDSTNVSAVKDAYLDSCPSATLGQMADAFMDGPTWSDFPSDSGGTIVELDGYITFDGLPASAVIQFDLADGRFQAVYLGINSVDQSMFMLNSLLTKMCDATY